MMNLIIPCYNENSRGVGSKSFKSRLQKLKCLDSLNIDLVFVDDGSTDDTYQVIYEEFSDKATIVRSHSNKGKGASILTGINVCKSDNLYTCYMDADMSVSPYVLIDIYEFINNMGSAYGYYFIYGSRYSKNSKIVQKRGVVRRLLSNMARVFLTSYFDIQVSDTQCGFKVFPTSLLKDYADILYPSRWLFDIELLWVAKSVGLEIYSIPVSWDNMENESNVNIIRDVKRSLDDLKYVETSLEAIKSKCSDSW